MGVGRSRCTRVSGVGQERSTSGAGLRSRSVRIADDRIGDAEFHYHLGLAYQKTDQPALAKQQFERVLKINPGFSNADDVRKLLAELR